MGGAVIITRAGVAALAAGWALVVAPGWAGAATSAAERPCEVRLLHLAAGVPALAVDADDRPLARGLVVGAASPYARLDAGAHGVAVRADGAAAAVRFSCRPGGRHTAFTTSEGGRLRVRVVEDARPPFGGRPSPAVVRVLHAGEGLAPVDLAVAGGPALVTGAAFATASAYAAVSPGATLELRYTGTAIALGGVGAVDLRPGTVHTIVLVGGGEEAVRALALLDGAGVGEVPVGGVQTGLAGATPVAAPSLPSNGAGRPGGAGDAGGAGGAGAGGGGRGGAGGADRSGGGGRVVAVATAGALCTLAALSLLRRRSLLAGAAAVLLVTAAAGCGGDPRTSDQQRAGAGVAGEAPAPAPASQAETGPMAAPTRIRIAAIGVDANLLEVGIKPSDGTMEVPSAATNLADAAWYNKSPVPGRVGPSVIIGHVSARSRPGVFARLSTLTPGQRIEVLAPDGATAAFLVVAVEQYGKDRFPTEAVYGPTTGPELRLVTCGGRIGPNGHFTDNVVVYAQAASP